MPTPQLPKTGIRLATSASFSVLREDAIDLSVFFASIFQPREENIAIQKEMKPLLGIVSFTEDQNRTAEHRWEIDSNIRGEPLEVLLSPTARYLKLRRAVLYADNDPPGSGTDLITALGFSEEFRRAGTFDASILSQTFRNPFILIKSERGPANTGAATIVTFYRGCKLANIVRPYDISTGADLGVYEDAIIYYAGRQQFTT